MLPNERGTGLLFLNNIGMIIMLWTLGVFVLRGERFSFSQAIKQMLSVGLIAIILALITVFTGLNAHIPALAFEVLAILGRPTLAIAMIIAGMNIYKLGMHALRFDRWNIALAAVRLVLVPGVLLIAALVLKNIFGIASDILMIFMIVGVMPVSINSISLAGRFDTNTKRAAEAVVFTHIFGIPTILLFLYLAKELL
jgi:predicted permease